MTPARRVERPDRTLGPASPEAGRIRRDDPRDSRVAITAAPCASYRHRTRSCGYWRITTAALYPPIPMETLTVTPPS